MNLAKDTRPTTSWKIMLSLCLLMFLMALYVVLGLQASSSMYAEAQKELDKPGYGGSVSKITLPNSDKTLNIPTWDVLTTGNIWSLVSADTPLPQTYTPRSLITTTLAQGDTGTEMKTSTMIVPALSAMFAAAAEQGTELMISSAYRSASDQEALYNKFVDAQGQAAADTYVAKPGASEHQTGLAVDLNDRSDNCASDSDLCSISPSTSQWLAQNSYKYGFIVRYPQGKQVVTGIAYEPWHYRYVGVALAKMIFESGLTLDEALHSIRPAYTVR